MTACSMAGQPTITAKAKSTSCEVLPKLLGSMMMGSDA